MGNNHCLLANSPSIRPNASRIPVADGHRQQQVSHQSSHSRDEQSADAEACA